VWRQVEANLSLGEETYVPDRLLYGLIPEALMTSLQYEYWQDEDDHIRGYPVTDAQSKPLDENAANHIIFIRTHTRAKPASRAQSTPYRRSC
jgi:hypothetical protein